MPRTSRKLIATLRARLAEAADPERALRQQRYLKSDMPHYGIVTPDLRRIGAEVLAEHPIAREADWEATVRALWDGAQFREERYVAISMLDFRPYLGWQTMAHVPLYEHMIITGAWWDIIDSIAPYRFAHLLEVARDDIDPLLRTWARDDNIWRRRSALISQLLSKDRTDTNLLADCLQASFGSTEFFVNKAMGWALRNYSYHNPDWVTAFVTTHAASLAPLTRREAFKAMIRKGVVDTVPSG